MNAPASVAFKAHDDVLTRQETPRGEGLHFSQATPLHEYFGRPGLSVPGPQAFMGEWPAGSSIDAHFHSANQFQVFFGVPGAWYKGHPLETTVVHYADAYVTYGPFGTATDWMKFFTLRQEASTYTGFMPQDRDHLVKVAQHRNLSVEVGRAAAGERHELIAEEADGLAAVQAHLAPGETLDLTGDRPHGGTYVCVTRERCGSTTPSLVSSRWAGSQPTPLPQR